MSISNVRAGLPIPLLVTIAVAALQGLFLLGYAVLEMLHLTRGRVTMGLTTALFFALLGAALLACAAALRGRGTWARGPVVLAQLIQLGVAWSFRGTEPAEVAVTLALVVLAGAALVGIFHPRSLAALEPRASED